MGNDEGTFTVEGVRVWCGLGERVGRGEGFALCAGVDAGGAGTADLEV